MAHDVFISYATENKAIADATCTALEVRGIRCWIAPRDVLPGSSYPVAISKAIAAARVTVVVLSGDANRSPHVKKEAFLAFKAAAHIIPLRVEDVAPGEGLEYVLEGEHWLDALTPPLEAHLRTLANTIGSVLNRPLSPEPPVSPPLKPLVPDAGDAEEPAPTAPNKVIPPTPAQANRTPILLGGVVALMVLIGLIVFIASRPLDRVTQSGGNTPSPVNPGPKPPPGQTPTDEHEKTQKEEEIQGSKRQRDTLSGSVRDADGEPLSGVAIELRDGVLLMRQTTSDRDGSWSFADVDVRERDHVLRFSLPGFVTTNLRVKVTGTQPPVRVVLGVGSRETGTERSGENSRDRPEVSLEGDWYFRDSLRAEDGFACSTFAALTLKETDPMITGWVSGTTTCSTRDKEQFSERVNSIEVSGNRITFSFGTCRYEGTTSTPGTRMAGTSRCTAASGRRWSGSWDATRR